MSRHDEREVCDADCMRANNCHGFAECGLCRERFCVLDLDDGGLCPDCAEKADAEREDDWGETTNEARANREGVAA